MSKPETMLNPKHGDEVVTRHDASFAYCFQVHPPSALWIQQPSKSNEKSKIMCLQS